MDGLPLSVANAGMPARLGWGAPLPGPGHLAGATTEVKLRGHELDATTQQVEATKQERQHFEETMLEQRQQQKHDAAELLTSRDRHVADLQQQLQELRHQNTETDKAWITEQVASAQKGQWISAAGSGGRGRDGTLATTAQFTSIRVVCNNTLAVALGNSSGAVKVPHSTSFDPQAVKKQLGISVSSWDQFMYSLKMCVSSDAMV